MPGLSHAPYNLGIYKLFRARPFLPGKRNQQSCGISFWLRWSVASVFSGQLNPCPFTPHVYTGCGFYQLGDIRSANSSRCLQKIGRLILGYDKFTMGDPPHQAKCLQYSPIQRAQLPCLRIAGRQSLRGEYPALVNNIHRRRSISADVAEEQFAMKDDSVHVIDLSWDVSFQQINRAVATETFQ